MSVEKLKDLHLSIQFAFKNYTIANATSLNMTSLLCSRIGPKIVRVGWSNIIVCGFSERKIPTLDVSLPPLLGTTDHHWTGGWRVEH